MPVWAVREFQVIDDGANIDLRYQQKGQIKRNMNRSGQYLRSGTDNLGV